MKPLTRLVVPVLLAVVAGIALRTTPSPAQVRQPATAPDPAARRAEQYGTFAMTHPGDPAAGRALFLDEARLACTRCHTVNGKGDKAGPDLSTVGDKLTRRELIDAIVTPSASIAVGYSTTVVKTKAGDIYQGVVKEAADGPDGPDGRVGLMGADGVLVRIRSADIESQRTSSESLMPEGLQNGLTPQQFADLVEYLVGLKLPASAAAIGHGMPATIEELEPPVALQPIPGQRFEHPVWFGAVPGYADTCAALEHDSGKIFFLKGLERKSEPGEGAGARRLFAATGHSQPGARGSVGLAFHPRFADNGKYYFFKQLVTDGHFRAALYAGQANDARDRDAGRPPTLVLQVEMSSANHFGAGLEFGPDGYLYVGIGDTGPQGDPHGNAQNMGLLRGKMLRLDVDHADPHQPDKPYAVPPDNPFAAGGTKDVRPEIWASGLRQPWRFSFDPLTGDLWEGDVGQDLFEEVNLVRRGGNFGWNVFEGFQPYSNQYRRESEKYLPPVFAYTRKYGASVTGGFVYRADPASGFYGAYVFGDYQTSRLFALTQENGTLKQVRQIGKCPEHAVSFGRDGRGELYVVGYEGTVYHLDLANATFK